MKSPLLNRRGLFFIITKSKKPAQKSYKLLSRLMNIVFLKSFDTLP